MPLLIKYNPKVNFIMKIHRLFIIICSMLLSLLHISELFSADDLESKSNIQPCNLRCEYLRNPLGIDIPSPRLSWNIKSEVRNQKQQAYQFIVSGSTNKLEVNRGVLWDT